MWEKLHRALLDRLGQADKIDWERLLGLGERAGQKGGERTGPNPTDNKKGKPGSKRHIVADREGVPLAVVLTAANVHDSKVLEESVDAIGPIKRPGKGRLPKRPKKLHADKGYDFGRWRKALRKRGIKARIAQRGVESSERLGRHRVGWWSGRWRG